MQHGAVSTQPQGGQARSISIHSGALRENDVITILCLKLNQTSLVDHDSLHTHILIYFFHFSFSFIYKDKKSITRIDDDLSIIIVDRNIYSETSIVIGQYV
jgi:hypothetical protein